MNQSDFDAWLQSYGWAWIEGNPQEVINLFSENVYYYEEPFQPPMIGQDAIRKYWKEGAQEGQRDITFDYQIISVIDNLGCARWQASFRRVPSDSQVELDGILAASFDDQQKCTEFREWWHRRES